MFCLPVSCTKTYTLKYESYNFAYSFVWVENFVAQIKGRTMTGIIYEVELRIIFEPKREE
jgi:hypothetical protein